ncbi:MAG: RNA methyltransferase [Deltaproteobacteria bacterium]|nr:RNA methyltransferase [Deltaproteobacteria bacterium]
MNMELEHRFAEYGPDVIREALTPFVSPERQARIEQILDQRLRSLTVVIENLYDGHNGAAAIRSIEAVGIQTLHAIEEASPFKIGKGVTIGCEQWVTIEKHKTTDECIGQLKDNGFILTATVPDADMALDDLDGSVQRALIFGNEHEGLTDRAIGLCDELVRIPMHGFTQSFNLSVSVALTVTRASAARRAALGRAGDLEVEQKRQLRARWYANSVRGAGGIIDRYVAGQTQ